MRRLALPVAVAVLLGVVVALALQVRAARSDQQARQEALGAARTAAVQLLSYDHRTVDDDLARAQAVATGDLLREYRAAAADLPDQARAGQAAVTAQVQGAAVVRGDRSQVVVLLFADQTTTRKDLDEARVDQSRLRLTLEPVDGAWLVSELERV